MDNKQVTAEWIAQQRQISEIVNMTYEDAPGSVVPLLKQLEKSQTAALDALEAAYAEIDRLKTIAMSMSAKPGDMRLENNRLTAERDAWQRDFNALNEGGLKRIEALTAERDAALKDLKTAMTDLYIEGRIDETDICWACKFAKKDKDEYPCNSCLNYEMTEFTHRGVREDE